MDKIVFSSIIAINEILTSHCDNLSTHRYHLTYHPYFNTQFHQSQTMQQYFGAVAMSSIAKKQKRLSCSCRPKRVVKRKKEIVLTRIGLTNMPLVTKGLIISSMGLRKGGGSNRWFPQTI